MATKEKKFVGLDPSAMFKAGAAGAGVKAKDSQIVNKIGQYALSYYMRAADNMREARTSDSKLFAQVEAFAMDSDLIAADISGIKNDLTDANKTLNSVRGMLFPNSKRMVEAQAKRDKALEDITKLSVDYKNFKEVHTYQQQLAEGKYTVQLDSGEQATAGYGNGNTAIQMYNTSILLNGQLEKALRVQDGELWVDYTDQGPFDGSWDNPNTKDVVEAQPKSIKLKDMEFATHENPNQAQLANDYITTGTELGMKGIDLENSDLWDRMKLNLTNSINKMSNKERTDYFFNETGWIDWEPMSLIDKTIKDLFKGDAEFKLYDENKDGELSADEIAGAKEIIKHQMLRGEYNYDRIINRIHNTAVSRYDDSYQQFKDNEQELIDKNRKMTTWERNEYNTKLNNRAIVTNIGNYGDFNWGTRDGMRTKLVWKNAGQTSGDGVVYQEGYHMLTYMPDKNSWRIGESLGNSKDGGEWKAEFKSRDALINQYALMNNWPADWVDKYNAHYVK